MTRTATLLATHGRLLRQAFEDAGGRELDTQGDSFFVAFRRPKDAVDAAVAAQRRARRRDVAGGRRGPRADRHPHRRGVASRATATSGSPCTAPRGSARPATAARSSSRETTRSLLEDEEASSTGLDAEPRARTGSRTSTGPVRIYQLVDPGLRGVVPRRCGRSSTACEGDERRLADAARRASQSDRETGESDPRPDRGRPGARARRLPHDPRGRARHRGRRRGRRRRTRRSTRRAGSLRTSC